MTSPRERWGYLPAPMMRLLEATGDEDLMLRVVARAGGRRMRVPTKLSARNQLTEALGPDDAARVWQVFVAEHETWLTVPRMTSALAQARAHRLLSLIDGGCTVHEAARRCGLTERGAYLALARIRANGVRATAQLDLVPAL